LEVAEAAARAASQIILSARPNVLAQQSSVRQKAGGEGPVTEADIAADRCIREHIERGFPDDHVVSGSSLSGSTTKLRGKWEGCLHSTAYSLCSYSSH
jgi:fructose-1,6-bisphosphatase/inositol monophosphatase family enzyme